jgi:acyl-CoA synthetase (AMP-forming)/AMP-acid ligase II
MGVHDATVYSILRRNARVHSDRIGLIAGQTRVTYRDFLNRTDRVAAGLSGIGVNSGDRVAVLAKNSLEFVYLYTASAKIGSIMLPINWRLSADEVGFILSDGSPRVMFVDPEFAPVVSSLSESDGVPADCFSMGAAKGSLKAFDELLSAAESAPSAETGGEDGFVIIHTAAVAGRPRGALLTHLGMMWTSLQLATVWGLTSDDVNLAMLPLFHVAGLLQLVSNLTAGGASVILPGFDPEAALKHIKEDKVTMFGGFSPMFSMLLDKAEEVDHDLTSLRNVLGLDQPETVKRFEEASGATFWTAYGQSETSGLTHTAPYFDKTGSAGLPLPSAEVEVVDDYGNILGPGRAGEIIVKGPCVFKGYWNLEEDTRYTFRDGWHHTGDKGRIDEEGYLWFEGRLAEKELIKPGGENVYPAEVEKAILEHPDIEEVSVIGVPDSQWGEAIKAVCVLKEGASLAEAELIQYVAAKIARYKKPKHVVYVSELPKKEDGSVDREKIKEDHGGA